MHPSSFSSPLYLMFLDNPSPIPLLWTASQVYTTFINNVLDECKTLWGEHEQIVLFVDRSDIEDHVEG